MITATIIDDEPNNIINLRKLIEKYCPDVKIISTALSAEEGEAVILKEYPDLLFLDIQMPGKNGFELLRLLPKHPFEIIFITAYDQYGIQAVKLAAIDYLLKPINIEDLKIAVQKAIQKKAEKRKNLQLENLIDLLEINKDKSEHRIALPTTKETRFVKTTNIVRCESLNNYTTIYLENKEKLMVSKAIYEYEELLKDYGFIRAHQSHLVNKKYIKSWIKRDGGYLLLEDNTAIPVSKQKREYLREILSAK